MEQIIHAVRVDPDWPIPWRLVCLPPPFHTIFLPLALNRAVDKRADIVRTELDGPRVHLGRTEVRAARLGAQRLELRLCSGRQRLGGRYGHVVRGVGGCKGRVEEVWLG